MVVGSLISPLDPLWIPGNKYLKIRNRKRVTENTELDSLNYFAKIYLSFLLLRVRRI